MIGRIVVWGLTGAAILVLIVLAIGVLSPLLY
jgi:hypothetical protein